uniref:Uncharacterized protein n=1 Tax=Arundo donax TaxID=35708 RepID=A0A0A8YDM3_ARUDO
MSSRTSLSSLYSSLIMVASFLRTELIAPVDTLTKIPVIVAHSLAASLCARKWLGIGLIWAVR